MGDVLFAERFTVVADDNAACELPRYDESRNYSVTVAGLPYVEAHTVASTGTIRKAEGEPGDIDRSAWEKALALRTPKTSVGKFKKSALRERFASQPVSP